VEWSASSRAPRPISFVCGVLGARKRKDGIGLVWILRRWTSGRGEHIVGGWAEGGGGGGRGGGVETESVVRGITKITKRRFERLRVVRQELYEKGSWGGATKPSPPSQPGKNS